MLLMHINVLLSLTQPTTTSKLVFNFCEMEDKAAGFLVKLVLRCHKMFILKHTKQLVQLVLLVLNGAIPHNNLHQMDLLQDQLPMDGEAGLLR